MKNNLLKPVFIISAIIVVSLIITIVSMYSYINNTRSEGIKIENQLIAQYQDNQNELSTYVLQINETLGLAEKQSEELNKILVEAVQGRYDGKMEPGTGGSMFSAISEAYPDLTANTEMYSKVQDLVVSGRNAYKNKQTVLLDRSSNYRTWLKDGLIRSSVVRSLGFPSDDLKITLGDGTVLYGQAAFDKLSTPILDTQTVETYTTGEQQAIITPRKKDE